jgi:hypothetical protein
MNQSAKRRFDQQQLAAEKRKLDAEIRKIESETKEIEWRMNSVWVRIERGAKTVGVILALIAAGYGVIEYAQPILEVQKRKYESELEVLQDSLIVTHSALDSISNKVAKIYAEKAGYEHEIIKLKLLRNLQVDSLRKLLKLKENENTEALDNLTRWYSNQYETQTESIYTPNEFGFVSPFRNSVIVYEEIGGYPSIYNDSSPYMRRLDGFTWVSLSEDANVYSPADGVVLNVDKSLSDFCSIRIKCNQYQFQFIGLGTTTIAQGDNVFRGQAIGFASFEEPKNRRTAGFKVFQEIENRIVEINKSVVPIK